jgi:hypothetical protein
VADPGRRRGGALLRTAAVAAAVFAARGLSLAQPTPVPTPPALPEPPTGFHWERAPEIKGAFLVPHKWFFKAEGKKSTYGYFISRENIDKAGEFLVGLSVNVMPHVEGKDAVAYAKDFMAAYPAGKTLLDDWDASMPPFVGRGCLVEDETTRMHTLMVANPKTNTLYLFIFEAPRAQWKEAWPIGEEILRLMLLDDEI